MRFFFVTSFFHLTMLLRFIYQYFIYQYFISLLLNNISQYRYITFCFFPSCDGHLENLFLITVFNNNCIKIGVNSSNSYAQKLPVTPHHTLSKNQSPYSGFQGPTCSVLFPLFFSPAKLASLLSFTHARNTVAERLLYLLFPLLVTSLPLISTQLVFSFPQVFTQMLSFQGVRLSLVKYTFPLYHPKPQHNSVCLPVFSMAHITNIFILIM